MSVFVVLKIAASQYAASNGLYFKYYVPSNSNLRPADRQQQIDPSPADRLEWNDLGPEDRLDWNNLSSEGRLEQSGLGKTNVVERSGLGPEARVQRSDSSPAELERGEPRPEADRVERSELPSLEDLLAARRHNSENAVLRQLEQFRNLAGRNRNDEIEQRFVSSEADDVEQIFPEYTESLPGSWGREARDLGAQKHFPICHLERKIVNLNTIEYEYRPAYYEEIKCTKKYHETARNEICSSLGFSCFQWNKTIHLTRRRYSSECWETKTMVIPAGCECMWPTHRLGDIKLHL